MRQHKHMAQTTHKTWFCHDPATRLRKSSTCWQNHESYQFMLWFRCYSNHPAS